MGKVLLNIQQFKYIILIVEYLAKLQELCNDTSPSLVVILAPNYELTF